MVRHGSRPRSGLNTAKAYKAALRRFARWLDGRPATDVTVAAYVAALMDQGKAPATIRLAAAAAEGTASGLRDAALLRTMSDALLRASEVAATDTGNGSNRPRKRKASGGRRSELGGAGPRFDLLTRPSRAVRNSPDRLRGDPQTPRPSPPMASPRISAKPSSTSRTTSPTRHRVTSSATLSASTSPKPSRESATARSRSAAPRP